MFSVKLGVDKSFELMYYMQADWWSATWSSIEVVITGTTGNRVYPKRVPRVQIPPAPPDIKKDFRLEVLLFSMN